MSGAGAGASPLVRMVWRSLLFIHWPIDAALLRPHISEGLEIDTFDGTAWIGLIPFTMSIWPRRLPPVRPARIDFHECNVRTYVLASGEPGVWFFSLDAASASAVWGARRFWGLPYFHARMSLDRRGDEVRYTVDRRVRRGEAPAAMRCRWRAGGAIPTSQPGDAAYFLTERYQLYCAHRGRLCRSRIAHDPWPLRSAELLELDDSLVSAALGAPPALSDRPLLHHADELSVDAWAIEVV